RAHDRHRAGDGPGPVRPGVGAGRLAARPQPGGQPRPAGPPGPTLVSSPPAYSLDALAKDYAGRPVLQLDRLQVAAHEVLCLAARQARTLSGGETQLVALARALVLDTDVLLLDEPTAHLDPARVARVEEALREAHRRRGATVVWATHNLFQARRVADRVALLL